MRVIAKELAFYRGSRVRAGAVIDLPEGARVHPWMHVLGDGETPAKPKDEGPTPIAPSELRKMASAPPIGVATAQRGLRKKKVDAEQPEPTAPEPTKGEA